MIQLIEMIRYWVLLFLVEIIDHLRKLTRTEQRTPLKGDLCPTLTQPLSAISSLLLGSPPFFSFADARGTGMETLGFQESAPCVQWP